MGDYDNQEFYGQSEPAQKSNKKIWLWILIPVLIIIIGLVIFYFIFLSLKTISDSELVEGATIDLKENNEASFVVGDETHFIRIDSVGTDSVKFTIRSEPIQLEIKIGEIKKVDLDSDGFYDVQIKLNSIENGVPEIYIKKIYEDVCVEEWDCEEWSACSEQGTQTRTCEDISNCGTIENRPDLEKNCSLNDSAINATINNQTCSENWNCTGWTSCVNGKQNRTCTDSNSCGTNESKPAEQQNCAILIIDCGSSITSQETIGDTKPEFDCLIDASENCEPAKMLNTITLEIFGMITTTTGYVELKKGTDSSKCVLYQRTESSSVKLSDEMVQALLDNNIAQEEIDQQEQHANETAQVSVGLEHTCEFDTEELTSMLNNWKEGTFHGGATCSLSPSGDTYVLGSCTYTGDYENATCVSEYP